MHSPANFLLNRSSKKKNPKQTNNTHPHAPNIYCY